MLHAIKESHSVIGPGVLVPLGARESAQRQRSRADQVLRQTHAAPARSSAPRRRPVVDARQALGHRARHIRVRLIRDQRYAAALMRRRLGQLLRVLAIGVVLGITLTGAVARESWLAASYADLPQADRADLSALRQRQAGIDQLVAANPLWLGALRVGRERTRLCARIACLEREQAAAALVAEAARGQRLDLAETARMHGRAFVEEHKFAPALEQFRLALWSAPPEWPGRPRAQADVAALEEWPARRASSRAQHD